MSPALYNTWYEIDKEINWYNGKNVIWCLIKANDRKLAIWEIKELCKILLVEENGI